MDDLELMFEEMKTARKEVLPAHYWEGMNKENLKQLTEQGIDNFKRTIAMNYFTWSGADGQIGWLIRHIPLWIAVTIIFIELPLNLIRNRKYARLTLLSLLVWY